MNKTLLYVLAGLGAIFAFYLLKGVWAGFSSTANPSAQVQKAKCIAECRESKLSENCNQYCLNKSLGK